jgi:glycosyltransferase involved in cell wall biosynthesis
MPDGKVTISACLVVYNEEMVIERCLSSLIGLVDEIIVVHDGDCSDKTLEIARRFTDKIFLREHVGMMEAHLVFAFKQAIGDWLLRIDADEFFDQNDIPKIKEIVKDEQLGGAVFNWELWNGKKTIHFKGLQKMCLVKKSSFAYCGIPHENGSVALAITKTNIVLHHRPLYSNTSWLNFKNKTKRWIPVHASFFFLKKDSICCFNTVPDAWLSRSDYVKKNIKWFVVVEPVKMLLGQLKNGLVFSWYGWNVALQQFYYYFKLYFEVMKMNNTIKYGNEESVV